MGGFRFQIGLCHPHEKARKQSIPPHTRKILWYPGYLFVVSYVQNFKTSSQAQAGTLHRSQQGYVINSQFFQIEFQVFALCWMNNWAQEAIKEKS